MKLWMALCGVVLLGCSRQETPAPPAAAPAVKTDVDQAALDTVCAAIGAAIQSVAVGRDKGVPLSEQLARVDTTFEGKFRPMGVYLRDWIIKTYDATYWTPEVARREIEVACFKAVQRADLGG